MTPQGPLLHTLKRKLDPCCHATPAAFTVSRNCIQRSGFGMTDFKCDQKSSRPVMCIKGRNEPRRPPDPVDLNLASGTSKTQLPSLPDRVCLASRAFSPLHVRAFPNPINHKSHWKFNTMSKPSAGTFGFYPNKLHQIYKEPTHAKGFNAKASDAEALWNRSNA
jgi:hypothetical protein